MSAYANRHRLQSDRPPSLSAAPRPTNTALATATPIPGPDQTRAPGPFIDELLDRLVDRVAEAVVARLENERSERDEWLDSRQAAEYLGLHRDTLRRLAAERAIPSEQDGRGCRLFFRRTVLDEWRLSGGRSRHLTVIADAE